MVLINDDPIISTIQRTGYPGWYYDEPEEYEEEEDGEWDD